MKVISFTMVNNESEIIESFVRYNYNFVDEMIIIDNGCTDNTISIIRKLISEGFKITNYDESLEAYNQYRLDNKYINKIIEDKKPDIIIPLDADEFLTGDTNPRDILENLPLDRIYYVTWRWYVMTKMDDIEESFIPKRMNYCLTRPAWNYSDGTVVTKSIIPAVYYKEMGLTLSMGHHTVFGNEKAEIAVLDSLKLAHYRAISKQQLIYKTCCYTMRDIATMENNSETAQRTNQMALIENGTDMWDAAEESSYGGYPRDIVHEPVDLTYCTKSQPKIIYSDLAKESITMRIMRTGQEMAIKAYNLERRIKNRNLLKPVLFVLDGVRETDIMLPNPSNRLTLYTAMYNVQGYITFYSEIKFLKCNYRLIINPIHAKFLPHTYIVIPDTVDEKEIREILAHEGANMTKVVSLSEYKKKIGILGELYSSIMLIPGMGKRVIQYLQRNGMTTTLKMIKQRIGR